MAAHCLLVFGFILIVCVWSSELTGGQRYPTLHHAADFPRDQLESRVKMMILDQLDIPDAPPVTGPPVDISDEIYQALMREKERKHVPDSQSIIRPKNNYFGCLSSNQHQCSRFEFEHRSNLDSIDSIQLWLRRVQQARTLNISVHFVESEDVHYYDERTSDIKTEDGWTKVKLMKSALETMGDILHCIVEISGARVYETGIKSPFLLLDTTHNTSTSRQRRHLSDSVNCSCCVVDRNISFKALKWDHWVFHPPEINIRACSGACSFDQGTFNLSYGNIMHNYLRGRPDRENMINEFWSPHCYPTKMAPVSLLHSENGTGITMTEVKNMVIESCACITQSCFTSM